MGGARRRMTVAMGTAWVAVFVATGSVSGGVGPGFAAAAATRPKPTTTTARAAPTTAAPTTSAPTTTAPVAPVPAPPGPGGSVAWAPAGRSAAGRPLLYTGSAGGAYVAWMDPRLTRLIVVPGSGDPGGPWPWGGQVAPESRPVLLAGFNGGFKWNDFNGGVLAFGIAFRGLVPGIASLIVYSDGTYTVGVWGRDNDPSKQVVAVRQNLGMLVDGGRPTPEAGNTGAWGAS